jgi:hypothetical protein
MTTKIVYFILIMQTISYNIIFQNEILSKKIKLLSYNPNFPVGFFRRLLGNRPANLPEEGRK